jgi:excisionase family DNA binding protein
MTENNLVMPESITEDTSSYISVNEMAKLLSIARVTAYQLTKTQGFPCFYIGKRIIIPLRAFNQWAEKQAEHQSVLFEK